jgi:hypothetical protein
MQPAAVGYRDSRGLRLQGLTLRLFNLNPELVKSIAAFHNHGLFGGRGYIKLTEKQIRSINELVNKIIKGHTSP